MRSEARAAIAAAAASLVLAGLLALMAAFSFTGSAAAEGASSASSTTASVLPSTSAPSTSTASTSAASTSAPSTSAPSAPDGAFTVDDASLRWGINNESNNRAFAPGTFNFLSAGKIPDPGKGGQTLPEANWKQRAGNVSIEKYTKTSNGYAYEPATWAGLRTDSDGVSIPSAASGRFSNHQVVLVGGTGSVDPTKGTAEIRWTGDFTVLYYSGYSFFYVSDPVLTVTGGSAVLRATLSGFASSMDDLSRWSPVAPKQAVLANLGHVDLAAALGFTATPAYTGVAVSVPAGGTPQVARTDDNEGYWGSFPQTFIDYQTAAGAGSYWYTSGGSNDRFKTPLPLSVSYDAGAPVAVPTPSSTAQADTISNPVKSRPTKPSAPSATAIASAAPSGSSASSGSIGASVAAPPLPPTPAAAARAPSWPPARPVDTVLALESSPNRGVVSPTWPWWAGSIAFVAAGVITSAAFAPPRIRRLLGAAGRRRRR